MPSAFSDPLEAGVTFPRAGEIFPPPPGAGLEIAKTP